MEATNEKILFLIESLRRNGFKCTGIHKLVKQAWRGSCPSLRRIQALCKEFKEGRRNSFERIEGQGRKASSVREENIQKVKDVLEEDNTLSIQRVADMLEISHTMAQRIITEDINKHWIHTKWVPHTLSEANKILRVERSNDLLVSLNSRLCLKNLLIIDEKFFYLRNLLPSNKIGCWVTPQGDEPIRQTARRSTMEKKFMVIFCVSTQGFHYYEILRQNESINSERYIVFL